MHPLFQSTLPVGGGTPSAVQEIEFVMISIHPPRGGRDLTTFFAASSGLTFQSTLPVGGGTASSVNPVPLPPISIHPPRGGRDLQALQQTQS